MSYRFLTGDICLELGQGSNTIYLRSCRKPERIVEDVNGGQEFLLRDSRFETVWNKLYMFTGNDISSSYNQSTRRKFYSHPTQHLQHAIIILRRHGQSFKLRPHRGEIRFGADQRVPQYSHALLRSKKAGLNPVKYANRTAEALMVFYPTLEPG